MQIKQIIIHTRDYRFKNTNEYEDFIMHNSESPYYPCKSDDIDLIIINGYNIAPHLTTGDKAFSYLSMISKNFKEIDTLIDYKKTTLLLYHSDCLKEKHFKIEDKMSEWIILKYSSEGKSYYKKMVDLINKIVVDQSSSSKYYNELISIFIKSQNLEKDLHLLYEIYSGNPLSNEFINEYGGRIDSIIKINTKDKKAFNQFIEKLKPGYTYNNNDIDHLENLRDILIPKSHKYE